MATVTGSIVALNAPASAAQLKFTYLSAPSNSRGSLIKSNSVTVTCDEDGAFSVTLAGGQYRVNIVGSTADQWTIMVDDSLDSFDILSLLSHGAARYDASLAVGNASASRTGLVRTNSNPATPPAVVYLVEEVDGLIDASETTTTAAIATAKAEAISSAAAAALVAHYTKAQVDALIAAIPSGGAYAGNPEGNVTAPVGSTRWNSSTSTLYLKSTGSGNTGWIVAFTL